MRDPIEMAKLGSLNLLVSHDGGVSSQKLLNLGWTLNMGWLWDEQRPVQEQSKRRIHRPEP